MKAMFVNNLKLERVKNEESHVELLGYVDTNRGRVPYKLIFEPEYYMFLKSVGINYRSIKSNNLIVNGEFNVFDGVVVMKNPYLKKMMIDMDKGDISVRANVGNVTVLKNGEILQGYINNNGKMELVYFKYRDVNKLLDSLSGDSVVSIYGEYIHYTDALLVNVITYEIIDSKEDEVDLDIYNIYPTEFDAEGEHKSQKLPWLDNIIL